MHVEIVKAGSGTSVAAPSSQSWAAGGEPPPEGAPSFFGQATNDIAPLLGGTAQAGSLVFVGVGGAVFCVTATEAGDWSLDTAEAKPLSGRFLLGADGPKELVVTSVDASGNSTGVAGFFILDTQPPPTPTLHPISVDSQQPVLRGKAQAGSAVMLGVGGAIYQVTADGGGHWSVDTASVTPHSGTFFLGPDGSKRVVLACTDAAGNTSTGEGSFLLDTRGAATPAPAGPLAVPGGASESAALLAGVADATRALLSALGGRVGGPAQRLR